MELIRSVGCLIRPYRPRPGRAVTGSRTARTNYHVLEDHLLDSIIAVLGTLAGTASAYALQQRGTRAERAEQRSQELRREQLAAVVGLAEALANHRLAMWIREDLRLCGADAATCAAARERSHLTRSAITAPLTTVTVLAPDLALLADEAAGAAYALRNAPTRQALTERRALAITAADALAVAARTLV